MVTVEELDNTVHILLQPNRSATWHETKWLMVLFACTIGIIALGWSLVGAWVILPFAGLELGLLVYLMYRVSHSTYDRQFLCISNNSIRIEIGNRHKVLHQFPRNAVHFAMHDTELDWQLPQLHLVAPTTRIELGHFLNLKDRQVLFRTLQSSGLQTCRNHWWKE